MGRSREKVKSRFDQRFVSSIPNVFFIKRDPVATEELPVFILKRLLPMMFALIGDVGSRK
jgi:hypothetical protein